MYEYRTVPVRTASGSGKTTCTCTFIVHVHVRDAGASSYKHVHVGAPTGAYRYKPHALALLPVGAPIIFYFVDHLWAPTYQVPGTGTW